MNFENSNTNLKKTFYQFKYISKLMNTQYQTRNILYNSQVIVAIGNIKSLKALDISYCKLNLTEEERAVVEKMNLEAFKIV